MSLISHWYFTTCLRMRPRDAANVIAILDALDLAATEAPLAEAALHELRLCDIWTRIYAVPQLFTLAAAAPSAELPDAVEAIIGGLLRSGDEADSPLEPHPFSALIEPLLDTALQGGGKGRSEALVGEIEAAAKHLIEEGTPEAEDVPYLSLPRLGRETIWLACVATLLNDFGMLEALANTCQEETAAATVALLRRCLDGERGRRASIDAVKVLHRLGTEGSGTDLAKRLVRQPRCLGKSEPDLSAVCAWLVTYDPTKPENHPKSVRAEFGSHRRFKALREPKRPCADRIGIAPEDMPFFGGLAWDVSLVTGAPAGSSANLAKVILKCWVNPGPAQVLLRREGKDFANGANHARVAGLCFAAIAAARLAVQLEPSSEERAKFLGLAASAEAVLSRHHDRWLQDIGRAQTGTATLTDEVSTVALYARAVVKDLVSRSVVTPYEWLRLADDFPWILPLLVRWMEDVLMAPQDDPNSLRWREVLSEVLGRPSNMESWHIPDQLTAGLLGRFLCDPVQVVKGPPDWRARLRKLDDRKKTKDYWRNILAQPATDAQEWLEFDWLMTDPDVPNSIRAAAAVERFLVPRDESTHGYCKRWHDEACEALSSMLTVRDLNRWLRFSLVDLVKDPQGGEAGKLALILVVQMGGPVHVGRLVDALLSDPDIPNLDWKVRFAAEALASRADVERHEESLRTHPDAPLRRLQSRAATQFWLSQCAALLAFCPVSPAARRRQFAEARHRQLGLHRSGINQTELEEEFRGHMGVLVAGPGRKHLHPWTQEQIITNLVQGCYQLFHADYWPSDQTNRPADAGIMLSPADQQRAQAVNANTGELFTDRIPPTGSAVEQLGQLRLLGRHGLEHLALMPISGQVFSATGRRLESREMRFTVAGKVRTTPIQASRCWALFDPDSSRGWRDSFKTESVEGLVLQVVKGVWRPLEQGIHDLMTLAHDAVPFTIILTVAATGKKWLFSALPGTLFELTEAHFAPAAWQLLRQWSAQEQGNLVGLRVTVRTERQGANGRLVLTFGENEIDDVNLRWRKLIDEGDIVVAHQKERGHFVVDLPSAPVPFPKELLVKWHGPELRGADRHITCIVTGWDEENRRTGMVELEKAEVLKLHAKNDDWAGLYNKVLGLQKGAIVLLAGTIGRPKPEGTIRAYTEEGLELLVAAHSFSLLPLQAFDSMPRRYKRPARLTGVKSKPAFFEILDLNRDAFALFPPGTHTGILIAVPHWGADHSAATGLFMLEGQPIKVTGSIAKKRSLRLGSKIVVTLTGDQFRVDTEEMMLYADANFEETVATTAPPEAWFAGMLVDGKRRVQVWEDPAKPGELVLVHDPKPANLFRPAGDQEPRLAPLPWEACLNTAGVFKDFRSQAIRVCLQVPEEFDLVPGWCDGLNVVGAFQVRGIELRRVWIDTGFSTIRRHFVGRSLQEMPGREDEEIKPRDRAGQDRDAKLRALRDTGAPLKVIASGGNGNPWSVLVLDLLSQGFDRASATLPVPSEELHQFKEDPRILKTREDAEAMLLESRGGWTASFKRVPARSLADYKAICAVKLRTIKAPPTALLFLGKLNDDGSCRMEFGMGRTLEVPKDRILIDERPLKNFRSVLFHGDQIKQVEFSKTCMGCADPETCEHELWMTIHEVDIEFGTARQVFNHAKRWRFVHTLTLAAGEVAGNHQPKVVAVKGFNEGSEQADREFVLAGTLAPGPQADALQERLIATNETTGIYGRLDTERFMETEGRVCEFKPVRFVFGADDIRPGDMLLVEAGLIKPTRIGNDVRLELLPLSGTVSGVAGESPETLTVTRREFSCREALLRRYLGHADRPSDALAGMIFAVNVRTTFKDGGALATMLKLPPRRWKPLVGALRAAGGQLFATVAPKLPEPVAGQVHPADGVVLRVELRPGMFFELKRQHLAGDLPLDCDAGTLIRLEHAPSRSGYGEDRVRVVVCQFSSWRYLTNGADRPGVLFPIDSLIKAERLEQGEIRAAFTVLDFPALEFSARYYEPDHGRWTGYLNHRHLTEVMSQRHPRFAWLGRMQVPNLRDAAVLNPVPPSEPRPGGRLAWKDAEVWFERAGGEAVPTNWLQVTFADVAVAEIIERAQKRNWYAHDSNTGHWTERGVSEPYPVPSLSADRGFVFPVIDGNFARLRYRSEELMKHGAPVGNLIDTFGLNSLQVGGRKVTVTVVAITQQGARYEGIWVEWAPGRVVELPIEMLDWRSGGELLPLSNFEWGHLCCGDELVVRLFAGATLDPDRIEILAWHRGQRAFGIGYTAAQTLLAFAGTAADGSILLGSGAVKLTLPFIPPAKPAAAWILTNTNQIKPAIMAELHPGDVVLIASEGDRIVVAGSPGFTAVPQLYEEFKAVVDGHPLGTLLIDPRSAVRAYNRTALHALIEGMGGALPVTVERVDQERKLIWFTFFRQMPVMERGRVTQGLVLGALDDHRACVRVGAGAIVLEARQMVTGLPIAAHRDALRLLVEQRVAIWLGKPVDGEDFTIGHGEDRPGDLSVQPLGLSGEGTRAGLIVRSCRSQRLYWISPEHLAWSELNAGWIEKEWCGPSGRPVQANLFIEGDRCRMSLLKTDSALRESNSLRPGHVMQVTYVGPFEPSDTADGGTLPWLVRSRDTGLLMRCDVPDEAKVKVSAGHNGMIEVATRQNRPTVRITCAPQGHRVLPVELPPRQLELWRKLLHGEAAGPTGAAPCPEALAATATAAIPGEDRLLLAYELIVRRGGFDSQAVRTALDWERDTRKQCVNLLEALRAAAVLCRVVAGNRELISTAVNQEAAGRALWDASKSATVALLGGLHSRCLRSLHLVTVSSSLETAMQVPNRRFKASGERLLELLAKPMQENEQQQFIKLATQQLMEPGQDRHEFAGALLACIGMTPPLEALPARDPSPQHPTPAQVLLHLARVCSPLVNNSPNSPDPLASGLARPMLDSLQLFTDQVKKWSFEVWLLPPLPPVAG